MVILTRSTYDALKYKPPLPPILQKGSGPDMSRFEVDGIVYLNLSMTTDGGQQYTLPYEPCLVCPTVTTNIFGIKAEERFKKIIRDTEAHIVTFVPKRSTDAPITINVYKEAIEVTHAYVTIAKTTLIRDQHATMVTAAIKGIKREDTMFVIDGNGCYENVSVIDVSTEMA